MCDDNTPDLVRDWKRRHPDSEVERFERLFRDPDPVIERINDRHSPQIPTRGEKVALIVVLISAVVCTAVVAYMAYMVWRVYP